MEINTIADIDIGTNSIHLVVVEVNKDGLISVISRNREMVRLGYGSNGDEMKHLDNQAIERGVDTLIAFSKIAKNYNAKIRAVATSAVREARNANVFIDLVREKTGIEIEIISGTEEGRLTYLGVSYCIPISEKQTMIVDIGGGSTETVIGFGDNVIFSNSEKIGTIRLMQRFFSENTSKENIAKCREYVQGKLAPIMKEMQETGFQNLVGTAGTFENIAKIAFTKTGKELPDAINGFSVSASSMLKIINDIIQRATPSEIKKIDGIEEKRADIILAGAIILEYILLNCTLKKVIFSPYALREGVIYDTVKKLGIVDKIHGIKDLRANTIYNLAKKFNVNMPHAEHVKYSSLKILSALKISGFGEYEAEILSYAAILHDIGYYISHDQHHKHSLYLIENSDLPGFTNDEASLIANIARYHRKSHPKKSHEEFMALSDKKKFIIKVLSGILRLAEGIDRRQRQLVESVEPIFMNNFLTIILHSKDQEHLPDIELWGANRRKILLSETLSIPIEIIYAPKNM